MAFHRSPYLDDMHTPALPLTPHPERLVPAGAGQQPLLVTLVPDPHLKYRALIGCHMTILASDRSSPPHSAPSRGRTHPRRDLASSAAPGNEGL